MRVKSEIWVQAYVRRCYGEGIPALVARRGNSEAGAIFIKVNTLDGHIVLYGPAPAGLEIDSGERNWICALGEDALAEREVDDYLARQANFDPDFWVVEVEDREGRHFLGDSLVAV